ncbi:MAG: L-histidine N(alpha)-methyltransferase [Cyanobacteria bacterium P01_D01_bin.128]
MQNSSTSGLANAQQSAAMFQAVVSSPAERLTIQRLADTETIDTAAQEVIEGLTRSPKALPPKFFYDDRGSQLFEQITTLPEYYLTRTETQILKTYAAAIARTVGPCDLIELGSGSSTKTRFLLSAYESHRLECRYIPVDVSGGILESSAKALLEDYPHLSIHGLVGTYEMALRSLPVTKRPARLIAFIGSTLGNLAPEQCQQFLSQVSAALHPGDYFLLGVDLHKASEPLEAAYNDVQGITAEFNLNMLRHLNWRFGGNFNLNQFEHRAVYNPNARQIEIYIESLAAQQVYLSALDLSVYFNQGECLLSEISRKFELSKLSEQLTTHGFKPVETYTDTAQWFGLTLSQKQ